MTTAPIPPTRVAMDAPAIGQALERLASDIAARHPGEVSMALVGVRRGGIPLAIRLQALLEARGRGGVQVGTVDITLYRDDAATALPNLQHAKDVRFFGEVAVGAPLTRHFALKVSYSFLYDNVPDDGADADGRVDRFLTASVQVRF